jgi:hypothetical protein
MLKNLSPQLGGVRIGMMMDYRFSIVSLGLN